MADAATHKARPEKPDEEKYKTDLAKAEKEHAAAQEKLVGSISFNGCSFSVRSTYCELCCPIASRTTM